MSLVVANIPNWFAYAYMHNRFGVVDVAKALVEVLLGVWREMLYSGAGGTAHKWFGMYFGYGNLSSWPAVRIGGYTSNLKTYPISFALPGGSDFRRFYLTRPSGKAEEFDCTASCTFTYDAAQGVHLLRWEDRTNGGAVRTSSDSMTVQ